MTDGKFLIDARHKLHEKAETAWKEDETKQTVKSFLSGLECEVFEKAGGVFAFFSFGQESAVAFRAELDALPVKEKTGLPFASINGNMHACGHDGHMAVCLGLARFASECIRKGESLPHNILLVFQPAEEASGGAEGVVADGVLQRLNVKAAFAFHLLPDRPAGEIFSRIGTLAAGTAEVDVMFYGSSVHIASDDGIDAMRAACEFLTSFDGEYGTKGFLRFGKLAAGSARNIVCGEAHLSGTVRFFHSETRRMAEKNVRRLAQRVAEKHKCRSVCVFQKGIPPVVNDRELFDKAATVAKIHDIQPQFIGDDFGIFASVCPCLYLLLGTGRNFPLHSECFDFDESALESGLNVLEQLARLDYADVKQLSFC